ncbi:sugar porter family MFS transporter [Curtobacterium sp. ISL-83]|uniref:sugar porter family MFS transporter n=1 Tax=Curtobacterium sp. ISL-83 TaxID=2819145 RepID=UPI001BEA2BD6|nr:sugar porter family MFS transporter [Curtobacterium sp. ISL-83]MBT2502315.1 sugar porter family MFS transporter [Curtobacterium sp. ISL-83]
MTTTTTDDDHVAGVPTAIPDDTGAAETAQRAKRHVTRVAFVAALGGLLYGYDTGVISGTLIEIGKEFSINSGVQELITASILVGAILGAFLTGPVSARIGRRRAILIIAGVFALGVLFAALSPSPLFLILSRLFLGLAVGGSTQTIPTYIAEIAPGPRRGSLVTVFNCAIGVGILAAALVGVTLNGAVSWRFMIGVAVVPAIVLLLGMLRLPESPRWFVAQDRIGPARRVLRWLRPDDRTAEDELDEIRELDDAEPHGGAGQWAQLRKPWVRPALIAGLIVAAFTQLTGLEMMIYYTPTILTTAGFPHVYSLWANVGVGVVYLVMTFVGSRMVDRIGRRRLTLVMLPGAAVSIGLFGALFAANGGKLSPVVTIVLILAFMFFQAGGIQVVGWLVGSEMYPLRIRAAATSLHAMVLWGADLLVTSTALSLTGWIGLGGTMLLYAALNIVAWILVFRRVPETKGKSLEQIEKSLRNGTFLPHRTRSEG